jgi:glycosyltransferase involved in cell wall biosynthesis
MAALLEAVADAAPRFDVIHSHLDWVHLPLLRCLRVPFLTTLHGRLDLPNIELMGQRFPNAPFVSISQSQRTPAPAMNWLATIHHGLPLTLLPFTDRPEEYLAFLGRIDPEKGPDVAIRVAHAAGLPLRIAAKVPRGQTRYFKERIKPLIEGNGAHFVGEVNDREKQSFLGKALALLFPISWPEPFGLVMIEAMACGTPVIAWPRGSVPEVMTAYVPRQTGVDGSFEWYVLNGHTRRRASRTFPTPAPRPNQARKNNAPASLSTAKSLATFPKEFAAAAPTYGLAGAIWRLVAA